MANNLPPTLLTRHARFSCCTSLALSAQVITSLKRKESFIAEICLIFSFLLFFFLFFLFFFFHFCYVFFFSLFICSVISFVCLFFPPNTIQGPLHSMSQCVVERESQDRSMAGGMEWRTKRRICFLKTDSHGTGSMNSAQSKEPMEHAHRVLCVGRIGI